MKKIFSKITPKKKTTDTVPVQPKAVTKTKKTSFRRETPGVVSIAAIGLHNLKAPLGSHKRKKLLGRGSGSGHGKTSTRGSKGQTSRAGRHFYLGFEGGQSPLIRRMPKRGFSSRRKNEYQIVKLKDLSKIKETAITLNVLEEKGLIENKNKLVKILGDGSIKNPVTVQAHAFSKRAAQEITAAGGKTEIVSEAITYGARSAT